MKKTKLIGAGLLLLTCFATSTFMCNRNGQILGIGNVESLTAVDSFWDLMIPNSERTLLSYNYQGTADGIISSFYFKGARYDGLWSPKSGQAYCCVSGSTHECKPGGSNNTPFACAYFGLGKKFWD